MTEELSIDQILFLSVCLPKLELYHIINPHIMIVCEIKNVLTGNHRIYELTPYCVTRTSCLSAKALAQCLYFFLVKVERSEIQSLLAEAEVRFCLSH